MTNWTLATISLDKNLIIFFQQWTVSAILQHIQQTIHYEVNRSIEPTIAVVHTLNVYLSVFLWVTPIRCYGLFWCYPLPAKLWLTVQRKQNKILTPWADQFNLTHPVLSLVWVRDTLKKLYNVWVHPRVCWRHTTIPFFKYFTHSLPDDDFLVLSTKGLNVALKVLLDALFLNKY